MSDAELPAILAERRARNADVTSDLSRQALEALEALLAGFSAAADRDGAGSLRAALEQGADHLYAGLLTVLLRLVFLLYCEDRGLLPTTHPLFAERYSLLGLFNALQADFEAHPGAMPCRFGAYPRLVGLFRAVFLGVSREGLVIPARRGQLFDPSAFPFLEGREIAPLAQPNERSAPELPSVDDRTIHAVLQKLLYLGRERLSYKALDVEQIGSVYEALMGFTVKRIEGGAARIRLGSKRGAARVWVEAEALLSVPAGQRARWLEDDLGLEKAAAGRIVEAVNGAKTAEDARASLEALSGRIPERAGAGTLVIQPGPERRRTSSHYTPRELTEPVVARTLDPLIKAMGGSPSSESLLRLVVCDPAVGSGAFLVAACRYLADRVVEAWGREGRLEAIASGSEDVVNHARRLVAQRCLYGVDKNLYAVQLARLSLWLVTMASGEPFTFVDHAIRHGDSLVGLNLDQLRGFHWKPRARVEPSAQLLSKAIGEALSLRKKILAAQGTLVTPREKEILLLEAEAALDRARLAGDLVIGAFFGQKNDKDREKERDRRLDLVEQWLSAEGRGDNAEARRILVELRAMQAELRRKQAPFHWAIELPEVFSRDRPNPLDGGRARGVAFIDAFIGNPPFLRGGEIASAMGEDYRDWLLALHSDAHGTSDICAHFFRRGHTLIGAHGVLGFIATNTIAEGETRRTGLQQILRSGGLIFEATSSMRWPGTATVAVAAVSVAFGRARGPVDVRLDGARCRAINSYLRARPEPADPTPLAANAGLASKGVDIEGNGFVLSARERDALLAARACNRERILPYVGGEDVTSSPTQSSDRWIIHFGGMPLEEAAKWPELLAIVRESVKPARDAKRDTPINRRLQEYWWQYWADRADFFGSAAKLPRLLVCPNVTKHLVFSFQPQGRTLSKQLYVFALPSAGAFAVLQSRVHEPWARLLSSSMRTDLRYSASDCFETFPFPDPDPRAVLPAIEALGEELYTTRARFMADTNQGLTRTYNALKDPGCADPRVLELRALHEAMDREVLAAYGWSDIPVPPCCSTTDKGRAALQAFEDEILDRLFVLNAERAAQEKRAAAAKKPGTFKRARKTAGEKSSIGGRARPRPRI